MIVDSLRPDHISGYGYRRETTPFIDTFIRNGVHFENAIAPGSWSPPSQVTIITGVYPYTHKINNFGQKIDEGVKPLSVILKENGYSTGLFSSHHALHTGIERSAEGYDATYIELSRDKEILDEALKWVGRATKPYFMNVVLTAPHAHYSAHPASFDTEYFTDTPPGGDRTFPFVQEEWVGVDGIPRSVRIGDHQELGFYINRYDREIYYADQLFDTFWKNLKEAGLSEHTLLIITSDHGEGLGDHNAFAHEYYLYDFLVRVPLVLYFPGKIPAGETMRDMVSLTDIVPTVLGFAGVEIPAYVEGIDLSGSFTDRRRIAEGRLATGSYLAREHRRFMIRSQAYKMIFDEKTGKREFYNLVTDPEEYRNLLTDEDVAYDTSEYTRMKSAMDTLMKRYRNSQSGMKTDTLSEKTMESLKTLGYIQ